MDNTWRQLTPITWKRRRYLQKQGFHELEQIRRMADLDTHKLLVRGQVLIGLDLSPPQEVRDPLTRRRVGKRRRWEGGRGGGGAAESCRFVR